MHGRGGTCMAEGRGACMAGGHVWPGGGMHGEGGVW